MIGDEGLSDPGEVVDITVPPGLDGVRADRALSFLTGLSRSDALQLIQRGAVTVNETVLTKASTALVQGQHFVARLPEVDDGTISPDGDVNVDVVIEGRDYVVVNKAAGQVVHPGAGQRHHTLVAGLVARYPQIAQLAQLELCDPQRPGIVHRLDKGTSGLLVVATTPRGYLELSAQLRDRVVERTYLGLVDGHVSEERGVIDAPIGRSTRTPTMMAIRHDGRSARTQYRVVGRLDAPQRVTLLEFKLETGRTHQIRVHAASIGHPIVNDLRYGHRRDHRLAEERFFLHSCALAFDDPSNGERVTSRAVLPEDLHTLVAELPVN